MAISQAIRRVMTCVLPVPAPATTSSGPSPCVTARRCSRLSPPSSASSPTGSTEAGGRGGGTELAFRPDRQLVQGRGFLPAPRPGHLSNLDVLSQRHGGRMARGCDSLGVTRPAAPVARCPEADAVAPIAASGSTGRLTAGRTAAGARADGFFGPASARWASATALLSSSDRGASELPAGQRLGIDARGVPGVETADDDSVIAGVQERQGEALVAAGVLERVEPDHPDPLEGPRAGSFERRGAGGQPVDLVGDVPDGVHVPVEHALEALAVLATRQPAGSACRGWRCGEPGR